MSARRICFVSANAYPILAGHSEEFMGGAEFQQVIIGRHMHNNAYEVSYITKAFGDHRRKETIEDIPVFKSFSDQDGWPYLRLFFAKVPRLWSALKAADSQVYYQRGAEAMTGIIALFCRIHKKTFIFSAAHDTNFIPGAINVPYWRDKLLYVWGLKHASHIIAQSHQQKRLLKKNFALDSTVAYNVYPRRNLVKKGNYVLWVANIKSMKRPLLLLKIARSCPDLEFRMVGGKVKGHETLYEAVKAEAATIENLDFLGFQSLRTTEELFERASLLVNTSKLEGFPNTFLQAWSRGIPTASFFDADDIIQKNGLGAVMSEGKEVSSILHDLVHCPIEHRQRIQAYFNRTHLPDRYLDHLKDLIGKDWKDKEEPGLDPT